MMAIPLHPRVSQQSRASLAAFGLSLCALACATPPPVESPHVLAVARTKRTDAVYEREYVGEVHALRRADVRPRIRGRLEAVAVDEGQPAVAGQLLFSLDDRELLQELHRARASVASAEAELQAAHTERASTKLLFDQDIVSATELALIDAKIAVAKAQVDEATAAARQAEVNLSYSQVRAPFAGVINRIPHKMGSIVEEGDLLTTLTDASEVLVYFRVPESEHLNLAAGDQNGALGEVSFVLANGERLASLGVLDAIESEVDRSTGTLAYRARFANDRGLLKHGSTGKVVVRTPLRGAVTVPQRSTFEVQDHLYLYVVDSGGAARARKIVPKLRLDDLYVVESGIGEGERFVLDGIQKVVDGTQVVVQADAEGAAAKL